MSSMEDEDYTEEAFEEHPEGNDTGHADSVSEEGVKVSDRTSAALDEPHKEEEEAAAEDRTAQHAASAQPETQQKSHGGMHVLIEQAVAQVCFFGIFFSKNDKIDPFSSKRDVASRPPLCVSRALKKTLVMCLPCDACMEVAVCGYKQLAKKLKIWKLLSL